MTKKAIKFYAWVFALTGALLTGCGGGGGGAGNSAVDPTATTPLSAPTQLASGYPANPASCDAPGQRAWLRDYMNDQYFWFDRQGTPDVAASSLPQYFASLLFAPVDRYSYAQSTAEFIQFFEQGQRTGYGYSLAWADAAQTVLKVRAVEPLSPIGLAGLRRGDTILTIDGYTPAQVVNGLPARIDVAGVARKFVVIDGTGSQQTLMVNSAEYPLSPVLDARVLNAPNGAKVGYLVYQEFITSGADALGAAFERFRAAGVTELVLDLRYNGGGSTTQARNLASLIGGSALDGSVFAQFRFNAKNTDSNFTQAFTANVSRLSGTPLESLSRVFIISSAATASASELLINGLRPFKPVITIGSTTFGKPYGFLPRDACGLTYNAVNFVTANAEGFSDYSAGFVPTCAVADDLARQLGDPAEQRTAAALTYIATGGCPVAARGNSAKTPDLPDAGHSDGGSDNGKSRRNELGYGEVSPRQTRLD